MKSNSCSIITIIIIIIIPCSVKQFADWVRRRSIFGKPGNIWPLHSELMTPWRPLVLHSYNRKVKPFLQTKPSFGRIFHGKLPSFKNDVRAGGRLTSSKVYLLVNLFRKVICYLYSSVDCFHIRAIASLEGPLSYTIRY